MAIGSRNKVSAEFSSATISDIVFLLLIYFMLTASFVTQSSIEVDLPTSTSQSPSQSSNNITIAPGGVYAWNNQTVTEKEELDPFVEAVLTDDSEENDAISLRVDKGVTFEEASYVMSLVAEYGGKIFILTEYGDE